MSCKCSICGKSYEKNSTHTVINMCPECFNKQLLEDLGSKTKPNYYGSKIDVIQFVQENGLDFMQGNVIKYVTRYKAKNGLEDLLKAKEYIDRIIENELSLQELAYEENLKLLLEAQPEEE